MSKNKRATKKEKERRILTVQGWIIDGVHDDFMLRQACTQWEVSYRQAERYLEQAYKKWMVNAKMDVETRRQAKIAELKQDLRSLKPEYKGTPQGLNAKARIQKMIIRLENIEPPKRIDAQVTGNLNIPVDHWLKQNNSE